MQNNVVLEVDKGHEVNFTLSPVGVQQEVQVGANAVAVTTTNPTLGQVVTVTLNNSFPPGRLCCRED